jgi:hypothetical protein
MKARLLGARYFQIVVLTMLAGILYLGRISLSRPSGSTGSGWSASKFPAPWLSTRTHSTF